MILRVKLLNMEGNCEKRPLENPVNNNSNKKPNLEAVDEQTADETKQGENPKLEYFNGVEISKLSKRQMKKFKKYLKWIDIKKEKRLKERLKMKEKRKHAKMNKIDIGPSRKELKKLKMKDSECKISVCVDLGFDELMIEKDMAKTIKQILRVYTENRRAKAPMQLHLTSFTGRSKNEMMRHHGFENWDINFHSEEYIDVFPKDKLIYLSSESQNIITKLEDDKIYIIGGLVDHNSHKGICYEKAVKQSIAHAQLPIGEYFWMKHRKVLTINQVFEILLRVSEGQTFKEAFEEILPKRIEKVSTENGGESAREGEVLLPKRKEKSSIEKNEIVVEEIVLEKTETISKDGDEMKSGQDGIELFENSTDNCAS